MLRLITKHSFSRSKQCAHRILRVFMSSEDIPGEMFSLQDSLPRLPVPPLEQTLQKYLLSVKPLVTDDEFAHTEKLVEDFRKGSGPHLQKILEQRARETTNWLSDWWKDVAYLEQRGPVVIYSNPALLRAKQNYTDTDGKLRYAAQLLAAVINFKELIDSQSLSVDIMGGKPLCMSQYRMLFGGCRIPGMKKDTHVLRNSSRHISVMHNNQLFSIDAYDDDNRPLQAAEFYGQLRKVVAMSDPNSAPVGVLTMLDRPSWAKTYAKLMSDETNVQSMASLQDSIILLCIDGKGSGQSRDDISADVKAMHQMLHGGGALHHSGNRWYDKTIQFIVGDDGVNGLNYEHTTAEGPPIVRLVEYVCDIEGYDIPIHEQPNARTPRKLTLHYSDEVIADIEQATKTIDKMVSDVEIKMHNYDNYGQELPKKLGLSPDAFFQMAFQLAYFKLHNQPCATYESASLRLFQLGRTDTIRSCTIESSTFCKAMLDPTVSPEVKINLFKEAVVAHRKYAFNTVQGSGIDRHMLGWKLAAREEGLQLPELFTDKTFASAFNFQLSTSQVQLSKGRDTSKFWFNVAFGAVVPDGYGIFYCPRTNAVNLTVSAYHSCLDTDPGLLLNYIIDTFDQLQVLFSSSSKL